MHIRSIFHRIHCRSSIEMTATTHCNMTTYILRRSYTEHCNQLQNTASHRNTLQHDYIYPQTIIHRIHSRSIFHRIHTQSSTVDRTHIRIRSTFHNMHSRSCKVVSTHIHRRSYTEFTVDRYSKEFTVNLPQ